MAYFFDKTPPRTNIKELKIALCAKFREKRNSLSAQAKASLDKEINANLLALAKVRDADEILSFSPLAGEVDVGYFNIQALQNGKALYLPRCINGTSEMNFHSVQTLDVLESGSYRIMEPPADAPVWQNDAKKHSVCIIPAMSYDKKGYRLGYGKGFYDRYLASKSTFKIGVCYSEFLSESLPRGRFDLAVDIIVTEKGIITVQK